MKQNLIPLLNPANTERHQLIDYLCYNRFYSPELGNLSALEVTHWTFGKDFGVLYAAAKQICERGELGNMPECSEYIGHLAELGKI